MSSGQAIGCGRLEANPLQAIDDMFSAVARRDRERLQKLKDASDALWASIPRIELTADEQRQVREREQQGMSLSRALSEVLAYRCDDEGEGNRNDSGASKPRTA